MVPDLSAAMQELAKYHLGLTSVYGTLAREYPWGTRDEHIVVAVIHYIFSDRPETEFPGQGLTRFISENHEELEALTFQELERNDDLRRIVMASLVVKARFCTSLGEINQTADILCSSVFQRYGGEFSPCEHVEEYLALVASFLDKYDPSFKKTFEAYMEDISGYWETVQLGAGSASQSR